ncbi:MAG: FkbM family methyltransferase [Nanoarchaeota archaeon]
MADINGLLEKYKKIEKERFFYDILVCKEYKLVDSIKVNTVIDVGALAGEFGAYIYDRADVIYALEPMSEHYQELIDNINQFGLNKIKPFKLALAGVNGKRMLGIHNDRGGHHLNLNSEKKEEVDAITLASFIKQEKLDYIDLLKIDIENDEKEIFEASDFQEVANKISAIIGEHLGSSHNLLLNLGFEKIGEFERNILYKRK